MKIKLFLSILVLIPLTATAQEKYAIYNAGTFSTGETAFLFADKVNIRSTPDTAKKNIIANLPISHKVEIQEKVNQSYTMNGFKSNWYKIKFIDKGTTKTGYIWGGLLSIVSLLIEEEESETYFLTGITKFSKSTGLKAKMRVVLNNKILSSTEFSPLYFDIYDGSYNYSVAGTICGNKGFSRIKKIITLSFEYGACGYPNGDIIFIFDGKKIFTGIKSQHVAEAGIFHFSTQLIFPRDKGGKKDKLIKIETTENFDEEKKDYVVAKKEKKIFTWNGTRFIESK